MPILTAIALLIGAQTLPDYPKQIGTWSVRHVGHVCYMSTGFKEGAADIRVILDDTNDSLTLYVFDQRMPPLDEKTSYKVEMAFREGTNILRNRAIFDAEGAKTYYPASGLKIGMRGQQLLDDIARFDAMQLYMNGKLISYLGLGRPAQAAAELRRCSALAAKD